jgi:hypothetical protein
MAYFSERQKQIILSEEEKEMFKDCQRDVSDRNYRAKKRKETLNSFKINL